jgi:hypothetical protein
MKIIKTIAVAAGFLLAASTLEATNHLVQIDEVVAGAFGRMDIQYVELKFGGCGQNAWGNQARLVFHDATGVQVGEFIFPSNPPDDCNVFGQSVLVGTQAYADLTSAPNPDFIIAPGIIPDSGKVCFKNTPSNSFFPISLCLSYGSFSGNSEQGSAGNAPALPALKGCALKRNAFFNNFGAPNFNADFALGASAPRNNAGTTGTVDVPPRFGDVPASNPFFRFVEAMFNAGVTSGCGGGNYCPSNGVTREQMAVFLLRAKLGNTFVPPACTTQVFNDVPCSSGFAPWINELSARGITGGCGNGSYCPGAVVTRDQMAVFLLVALEGNAFSPPACVTPAFTDVPCSNPFAAWINELAARGISGGCSPGLYCPGNTVTREQMAVFLSSTFSLPVPSTTCP